MRKLLGVVILITLFVHADAQDGLEPQNNIESIRTGNSAFRSFDHRDKELRGTLNVFEIYLPGKVKMNSGQMLTFDQMNYDGYYDAVIVSSKGQDQVVTTSMVESFYVIEKSDTIFFEAHLRPDDEIGFYQRLSKGKHVSLYKKHVRKLEGPTYTGAYSSGKPYSELVPVFQYFVKEEKFRPKEFKNKKMFLEMFPTEREKLNSFIKVNRVDFKRDEHLIALVRYLDTIR